MKLNLRSVDLNLLTVFEAIMDARQLSKASEELGMSQPAMSAALKRLRHTFRDDLFIRAHQGMMPTPQALIIYRSITPALEMIRQELQNGREFDAKLCHRHFRILGGDYVEILFLCDLINNTQAVAPDTSIEIRPLQVAGFCPALKLGELDVAVHYSIPNDDALSHEHIYDDNLVVVARRGHPRIKKRVTEEMFFTENHVALSSVDHHIGHLELFLQQQKINRKIVAQTTQFSSMIPVIMNTDTICVMPERLATWFSKNHPLRRYTMPIRSPKLPIYMLWAKRFDSDLSHAWFRSELRRVMGMD